MLASSAAPPIVLDVRNGSYAYLYVYILNTPR